MACAHRFCCVWCGFSWVAVALRWRAYRGISTCPKYPMQGHRSDLTRLEIKQLKLLSRKPPAKKETADGS